MNISPDGFTVRFNTEPESVYRTEKSGAKNNIARILDIDEWRLLKKYNPKKIIIHGQHELFLRTITNIHFGGVILGKVIATLSWTNEKHHYSTSREIDSLFANTMNGPTEPPLPVQAINISLALLNKLDMDRRDRTYDEFIQELYQIYLDKLAEERGPLHD